MKLSKFIKKIDLEKYPNITLFGDEFECTECGATAEIGTIIHANDNLAEVFINKSTLRRIFILRSV